MSMIIGVVVLGRGYHFVYSVSVLLGSFSRVMTALEPFGRITESISTALSRNHPGLFRKSRIIQRDPEAVSARKDFSNSSMVCSPKNPTSRYPILPVRIFSCVDGTRTRSLIIFVVISVFSSPRRYFIVIMVPFGHRILSTACSVERPVNRVASTDRRISPFFSPPFSAGEFLSTFCTFIHFGCSSITAPIHSKSQWSVSLNSQASFGGKYELCLSQRDRTSDEMKLFSISIFVLFEKW